MWNGSRTSAIPQMRKSRRGGAFATSLPGDETDIVRRMRKFFALSLIFLLTIGSAGADNPTKKDGALQPDKDGEKWAQKTLKKMTLEEKVGQLFMVWARIQFTNVNSPEYLKLKDAVQKYHLGGLGVSVPVEGAMLIKPGPFE